MKEHLIKPFLRSLQEIVNQITGMNMEIKDTSMVQTTKAKDVTILIGVSGGLEGQTMINLEEPFAMQIASSMMGGMPITEFDEISKSAVAELGNMVLGNAAIHLYNEGCKIDITPPTLLIQDYTFGDERQPIVSTTLESNIGKIEINLALKVK